MRKCNEITDPSSCLNRAGNDEYVFVLLARDKAAPVAIRAWCAERIRTGKNTPVDQDIVNAIECAIHMEMQFHEQTRQPIQGS